MDTLLTKEPDTIKWLDSMQAGEVLYDVGANIGQYTLYAAARGINVLAFEPESQNYALLCKNLVYNRFETLAFPVCLSDQSRLGNLHLSCFLLGGSCHSFDKAVNFKGEERSTPFKQGSISITLDSVVEQGNPTPNYVKIDVDGFEPQVVGGMKETLPKLKSLLVEINSNLPEHRQLAEDICKVGFTFDEEQVKTARRTEGPFKGVGNYIFHKI